jgi:hypothetical protein
MALPSVNGNGAVYNQISKVFVSHVEESMTEYVDIVEFIKS